MAFIFGGDTNMSYEDVQNKRKIAESLLASNLRTPQNVGEGIAAIGRALAARTLGKRSDKAMDTLDSEWATKIGSMGVDPSRIELWKNLPYDQRNAVALQYMDTMDAERRANARAGASASAAAAKEAAKAAEEAQRRQAIIAALGGGAPSQAPSGDFITGGGLSFGSKSPPPPESNPMPQGNVNTSMLRNGDPNLIAPMMMPPAAGSAPVQPPIQQPAPVQPPVQPPAQQPATAMPPMPTTPGLSFGTMQQQQPQSQEMDIRAAIARALSSGDMETASALAEFVDVLGPTGGDAATGGTDYSLTPQYVTNPDGTLGMIQLGKDGSVNVVEMPEGLALQKGVEKLDLGTAFQWYNTVTGEPIGQPIPKDIEGEAAASARGSATGKAEAENVQDVPRVIAQTTETINLIDSIINDPNLPAITGKLQGRLDPEGMSGLLMSQEQVDLAIKVTQLQGKAFMEAFDTLKGGGQITEREGAAATAAIARLQRVQSYTEYRKALNELRTIADNARRRAQGENVPEYAPTGSVDLPPTSDVPTYNPQTGRWE